MISPSSTAGFAVEGALGIGALVVAVVLALEGELVAVVPSVVGVTMLIDVVAWSRLPSHQRAAFSRLVRARRAPSVKVQLPLLAALPWAVLAGVGALALVACSGEQQLSGLLAVVLGVPLTLLVVLDRVRATWRQALTSPTVARR